MNNNFHMYEDMIPEDGLPILGMRIVSYLNENGTNKYLFKYSGDGSIIELIGLLELIKAELATKSLNHNKAL